MNQYRTHGVSTVLIVIILIIVAGGIVYMTSDVWSTRMNAAYDQYAHWTPENIAKDPVNYLNFIEKKAKEQIEKIDARRIAIAQKKVKLEEMHEKASAKSAKGEELLRELRVLHETAKATGEEAWPLTWQGQEFSKEKFVAQVKRIHSETVNNQAIADETAAGIKTLDAQSDKIAKAKSDAELQLSSIAANREMLEVKQITEDLSEQWVNMRGALEGVDTILGQSKDNVRGIDEIAAQQPASSADEDLDKIFAEIE